MTWGPGSMESWGDRSFAELALKISCTMWVPRHSVSWPVLDTSHHHECWSKSNRFPQILGYIPIISPSYPPQMMLDINHLLFLELFVFTYPFAHCPSAPLLEQRWQHRRLRPVTGMEWERRLGGIRGNISTSSNPSWVKNRVKTPTCSKLFQTWIYQAVCTCLYHLIIHVSYFPSLFLKEHLQETNYWMVETHTKPFLGYRPILARNIYSKTAEMSGFATHCAIPPVLMVP